MRRLLPLILCSTVVVAAEPSLSITAAIEAALADHPDTALAGARLAEAQARLRQANAVLMPRLSFDTSYTVTDQPVMAFMGLLSHDAYGPGSDPNNPPLVDDLNLGLNLRVPLYTPGQWAARSAAVHGAGAATAARQATRTLLVLTTVQAFIGVHQAQDHLTAVQAGLEAAIASNATAQARVAAGSLTRADLLRMEAQRASWEAQVAAARGGIDLAGQALAAALGRNGSETHVEPIPDIAVPADIRHRPELTAAEEESAAAADQLAEARAQYQPRVGAFAGYGYDRGFRQPGDAVGWRAGLGAEWTLFDGGATSAGVEAAEARQAAARALLRRTMLQIEHGRSAARTRVATVEAQLPAMRSQVAAAHEAARLQGERFTAGAATATDVAGADAGLAQARIALADAQAARLLAIADLRFQLGHPILP